MKDILEGIEGGSNMIKKIYAVKETCPMFGRDYEAIKYPLLTSKEEAEQFKIDLEVIDDEKYTCCEYEIIEFDLSNDYEEDKYIFHRRWGDMDILDKGYCEDFKLIEGD